MAEPLSVESPVAAVPVRAGEVVARRRATHLRGRRVGDRIYGLGTMAAAVAVPVMLLIIALIIGVAAWPALRQFGFRFLTSSDWDPVKNVYGVAPAIYGTLVSSFVALLISTPLALGSAVFLTEYAPAWLRRPLKEPEEACRSYRDVNHRGPRTARPVDVGRGGD